MLVAEGEGVGRTLVSGCARSVLLVPVLTLPTRLHLSLLVGRAELAFLPVYVVELCLYLVL